MKEAQFLFSHPTGNANVRHALTGLMEEGLLREYHTSIASFPNNFWSKLGRFSWGKEFQRRAFDPRLETLTRQHPFRDLGRMVAGRLRLKDLTSHEKGYFSIDSVYQAMDRAVARRLKDLRNPISAVYAYEDGAEATFEEAKSRNLSSFYDLPIGHWRAMHRLLEAEHSRWPAWSETLGGFRDSEAKLQRKDHELKMADCILVASSFTARTLQDFPQTLSPVKIIPYGFPDVSEYIKPKVALSRSRPLKMLFVGGLSQRKGIADVFAVADELANHVELTVVGNRSFDQCKALELALARHRWIPSLPHADILKLMQGHDLLLFPSLFEGFGLVITEAMSQGTPVITTDRTAGPDIIESGKDGWLIPAGSTSELRNAVERILENPAQLDDVGQEARLTALARPWSAYSEELGEALKLACGVLTK